jgi:rhodanese-related sulfurtransferase
MMHGIDSPTLKAWMDAGDVLLIDVREVSEYEDAAIPGAVLVPLATVGWDKIPALEGRKLVMQCLGGVRSAVACQKLLESQPGVEIYNLDGGIKAWAKAGYPIR